MPYYSELGLTSVPSSSAYSSLLLSGPYSNHSSIIASNYIPPKSIPRQYRGIYKPHLSTITELNAPRRINSPKLLYQGTPEIRPIKKINTADIDVSVNKYKRYNKYDRSKPEIIDKKFNDKSPTPIISPRQFLEEDKSAKQPIEENKSKTSSVKEVKSPRESVEEKEQKTATPNSNIRRDRATIRLHTIHKDTLQKEIGEIRSWRDNFKPEELGIEARRVKKTPGEILKEKFLIRSRSKENILKQETKKPSRKNSVRKSPSFHDICEAITQDNIDVDLNPGQPEEIQRRQSRQISTEKILKHIRRSSTDLSEDDLKILDAILLEQDSMPTADKVDSELFESRGSVRKKRVKKSDDDEEQSKYKIIKSHSREKIDSQGKPKLQRRYAKKRSKALSDEEFDDLQEDVYQNVIRDISQVEIEQTAFKPKPVITGSSEIEKTKPSLKAVVDDVEVQEAAKPKIEKKFRFNVIVEVEDEENDERRLATPEDTKFKAKGKARKTLLENKLTLTDDQKGTVQIPKPKEFVISSILKKRSPVHKGIVIEEKTKPPPKCEPVCVKKDSKESSPVPASPTIKEKNLFNKIISRKENASDPNLFERQVSNSNKSLYTTPTNSTNDLNNSSAPSSPFASKRNIFNKDFKNNDSQSSSPNTPKSNYASASSSPFGSKRNFFNEGNSGASSPNIFESQTSIENISTPTSPFGSKSNQFNKKNAFASSPNISNENTVEKLSTPSSPLASKINTFSKGVSTPSTPKSNNVSASSSPFGSKTNLFNKNNLGDCSPNIFNTEKNLENSSVPFSPFANKRNMFTTELSKKEETSNSLPSTPTNKNLENANSSSPFTSKRNIFSKDNSKDEDTAPSSPLLRKEKDAPLHFVVNKTAVIEKCAGNSSLADNKDNVEKVGKEDKVEEKSVMSPTPKAENLNEEQLNIKTENQEKLDLHKQDNKDENCNIICSPNDDNKKETVEDKEETAVNKKLISKRSLVQKANRDDPDLEVFVIPDPEPEPEPEPEEKQDTFVPLQSNRLSQFMHPFKKPEQFDVCPVEIFARPKVIRGRHYPRPRGQPAVVPTKDEESNSEEETDDDEEETEEETSSEEETSEEEGEENMGGTKIGASTSSNDSGFGSGAPGENKDCDVNIHKKCEKLTANLCGVNQKLVVEAIESVRKGSLESRDSPTTNHANNPAFALDSDDIPEEYSQSSTFTGFQKSGRITPPATTIPRFRKYCLDDFNFLKVLGKGSFGKVLLAELKGTEYYYAIKCLKKDVVLEDDDVECTLIERKVLALGTKHPYLCHLLCTFQTESHLFFVMEYLNGGDLMFHIQASGRFPEHQARFYGAEIVSGLKFLHNKGIVYRDLKLDNVLLDFDGHVRIADFGMCKLQIFLDRMAETFCGTPDYMAPEIIKGQHYNQSVDWWSFGVLLYEMLLGQSPFSGCDEDELFWSICNEKPVLPRFLSSEATNILTLFLEKDSSKRLGNRFCAHGDIQDQPFFKPIDWYALEARQLEAPFKPNLQHPLDTQYFDKHFTVEKAKLTPIDTTILQSMDQTQFQGFSYTNPNATDK